MNWTLNRPRRDLWLVAALATAATLPGCTNGDDDDDTTPEEATPTPAPIEPQAVVLASDYGVSRLATVTLDDHTVSTDLLSLGNDVTVRAHGEQVFLLIRELGKHYISARDPRNGFAELYQVDTGGSNPQDLVVASGKAWVSLYSRKEILVFNPEDGSDPRALDISSYAGLDGTPNASPMVVDGTTVYVALQHLDDASETPSWAPEGPGLVLAIDSTAASVTKAIELTGTNPVGLSLDAGGNLLVTCVGTYAAPDGGIELISKASLTSSGFILPEALIGKNDLTMVAVAGSTGYFLGTTGLTAFQPDTGTIIGPVEAAAGINAAAIWSHGSELWLAERDSNNDGNLWIYDTVSGALVTSSGLDLGTYAAASLAFLEP